METLTLSRAHGGVYLPSERKSGQSADMFLARVQSRASVKPIPVANDLQIEPHCVHVCPIEVILSLIDPEECPQHDTHI